MIMEFKNPVRCIFYNTGTHTYTEFQKNGRFKIMENVSAFKNDEGYSFYSNEDYISTSKYEEKISEKMAVTTPSGNIYTQSEYDYLEAMNGKPIYFPTPKLKDNISLFHTRNSVYKFDLVNRTISGGVIDKSNLEQPVKVSYINSLNGKLMVQAYDKNGHSVKFTTSQLIDKYDVLEMKNNSIYKYRTQNINIKDIEECR